MTTKNPPVTFSNIDGEELQGVFHKPNQPSNICVIVCHGFASSKDFRLIWHIADDLAKQGYNAFRFDFSTGGEANGETIIAHYTKQSHDLHAAIDYVFSQGFATVALVGHSLGGSLSLLATSRDKRIKACASIAAPVNPQKDMADRLEFVTHEGEVDHYDFRLGKRVFKISKEYMTDLSMAKLCDKVSTITVPLLFIHGDRDNIVPISDMHALDKSAKGDKRMVIIEGANHLFTGEEGIGEIIADWLQEKLNI